eukprot:CAMPEP_0183744346 /NCGR_PEP_ID=MMETSP0737-20130205/65684_1 /TAXON_ID=385413 /ORGANISM="Thalassiosira miniscula, Strain CCMP1093" /LENGTH=103 /DNA_ID=CAMNT_0025979987 /DNA_START=41 /DNA_END=352 /DNA_ORIENTATION=-
MILPLISKLCWSIRHISLPFLNFANNLTLQNENVTPLLHSSIVALAVLLPLVALLLWCCLAFDEWYMEEDSRTFWRRVLEEEEEIRRMEMEEEELERLDRKDR